MKPLDGIDDPDYKKEKRIFNFIFLLSTVVFIAVIILNKKILPVPAHIPSFIYLLPALNAIINATCTALLITSFLMIKRKKVAVHKKLNITTFILSSLFLLSYITYHWLAHETSFPKDHPIRPLYLFILITHIVLAAAVLPLILISFYFGLTNQVIKHRRIAKWSFPIWLYVTTTGVIVYLMISPYYTN